jgi:hypothetical protein
MLLSFEPEVCKFSKFIVSSAELDRVDPSKGMEMGTSDERAVGGDDNH